MININYSEELIQNVEILSSNLELSTDEKLHDKFLNFYLNPLLHVGRIKNVLSLDDVSSLINEDSKIVEIGSGIGTNCILTKALVSSEVYGIEPAPGSYKALIPCIESFKKCNSNYDYTSIQCGGEELPFQDNSIDFIYSFEVLEHVRDPQKMLREIYRVLKKDGIAYISTCNYDSFYEGHYARFWNPFIGIETNKKRYIRKGLSPVFFDELNFVTKKKIMNWINDIGFSEIKFNPENENRFNSPEQRIKMIYPSNFRIPNVKSENCRLHSFIEKKTVADFLSRFDREYKLYFTMKK